MANNCLVTKLKGTVNNDMLPRFGWHGIKVNMLIAGDFNNPFVSPTATSDVMIRGNAYFADDSGANLGKTGKATFHHIHAEAGIFYLDWKDGSLSGSIDTFRCNSNDIDLNVEDISYIFNSGTYIYNFIIIGHGDIATIMQKIKISSLGVLQLNGNNNLIGDITNIQPASIISIQNTSVTGTLESLFQKYASSINKTKTITFEITGNPGITYQGVKANFYHKVSFDGAGNYTILDQT